jgi:hypothetical protein
MEDPVNTEDSHTYEREAIQEWLTKKLTSPVTGAELKSNILKPNYKLRNAIDDWTKEQLHSEVLN